MKKTLALVVSIISCCSSTSVFADDCQNESAIRREAIRRLYDEREAVEYVCGPSLSCSEKQFTSMVEVKPVVLTPGTTNSDGLAVTPKTKGVAYFTALFLKEQCSYRMVFSPDSTSSGLKLLRKERNGKYLVTSTDRSSRSEWAETEYAYDKESGVYQMGETKCFAFVGGKEIQLPKCE